MQPLSPQRQAAIEKCIRAIEECKSVLAQSGQGEFITDDGLLDELPLRVVQAQGRSSREGSPIPLRAGRAQGGSPRVGSPLPLRAGQAQGGSPRVGSPLPHRAGQVQGGSSREGSPLPLRAGRAQDGSPRAGSPRAGSPHVFRQTPYIRRGSTEEFAVVGSASPVPYPEEDVWAWLDGTADEPPAHRPFMPSSGGVPPITFPRVAHDASRNASLEECGKLSTPPQDEKLCAHLGTSSPRAASPNCSSTEALRDVSWEPHDTHAGGGRAGGPRVFRTTPYIRRGGAPIVSPSP